MEEVLRQMLLLFGGLAIAGIFVHGMWTIRKKPKSEDGQNYEPKNWSYEDDEDSNDPKFIEADFKVDENDPLLRLDSDDITDLEPGQYDELGLGEVRVVSQPKQNASDEEESSENKQTSVAIEDDDEHSATEQETPPAEPKIYASVVTQPKPEFEAEQKQALKSKATPIELEEIPEPPSFLLKKEQEAPEQQTKPQADKDSGESQVNKSVETKREEKPEVPPAEKFSLAEQAKNLVKRKRSETSTRKRKEPKVREDQMRIDFDEPVEKQEPKVSPDEGAQAKESAPQQEVLVLNVKAPEDKPIQGAALLPMLLTLGFKFGDQDIFHRHVNSNGKGPVLFSLANMFKPGNFDIDDLENFTTQGVSLFMILPIEGDPHQVFNMMHNAARKISDEFEGQVLDGRRSALNKQNLQQYVEKIREFERMRRIAR